MMVLSRDSAWPVPNASAGRNELTNAHILDGVRALEDVAVSVLPTPRPDMDNLIPWATNFYYPFPNRLSWKSLELRPTPAPLD